MTETTRLDFNNPHSPHHIKCLRDNLNFYRARGSMDAVRLFKELLKEAARPAANFNKSEKENSAKDWHKSLDSLLKVMKRRKARLRSNPVVISATKMRLSLERSTPFADQLIRRPAPQETTPKNIQELRGRGILPDSKKLDKIIRRRKK